MRLQGSGVRGSQLLKYNFTQSLISVLGKNRREFAGYIVGLSVRRRVLHARISHFATNFRRPRAHEVLGAVLACVMAQHSSP